MKKTVTWILVAAVALVVVAVGGAWWYARSQQGTEAAPLGVSTTAPSVTADPADLTGDYAVVEGSEAGYRVEEVLSGQDVTVVGRTQEVTGTVTLADGVLTAARVEVALADVATDEAARDRAFDQLLGVDEHPTAVFETTEPVDVSAAADGSVATVEAAGTLTVAGVTQPATATLQVQLTADGASVSASVPVTFADYGISAPNLGFVQVQDAGTVEALLRLTAA